LFNISKNLHTTSLSNAANEEADAGFPPRIRVRLPPRWLERFLIVPCFILYIIQIKYKSKTRDVE